MDAKAAKRATEQAERDHWKAKEVAAKKEAAEYTKNEKWAMETMLEPFKKEVYKEIRSATKNRDTKVTVSTTSQYQKVIDTVVKELKSKGYVVSCGSSSGYTDYGDFNAPCDVWETHSWMDISWERV